MNHIAWGQKRQFFSLDERGWYFYPLGIEIRERMIARWRKECQREGFEERMTCQNFFSFSEEKIAQLEKRLKRL